LPGGTCRKEYNPAFPEVAVKRWIALLSVLWLISASWAQKNAPALAPVTVIRAGVLIDGVSGSARRDQVITIRGNTITEVADAGIGGMPWTAPIAQEFPRMVEFGMTPMQAIQSATSRAAELLEMKGRLGVIAPGAYADVVAVSGDPLANVKILENVGFVMKDSKVFKNDLASNNGAGPRR
jgi:hypothetical protein